MTSEDQRISLISRLADEIDRRGWRDPGDAARTLALALERGQTPRRVAADAPSRFLAVNSISRADVEEMIGSVASSIPIAVQAANVEPARELIEGEGRHQRRFEQPSGQDSTVRRRPHVIVRLAVATVVLVGGSAAIWLGPSLAEWRWLLDHPNRLALQALTEASIGIISAGIAFWKWQIVAASGGAAIALLGLLGR